MATTRTTDTDRRLTYTVTEVAELLGISRASAYNDVRSGEIPSVTLGSRIIVPRRAIDELPHGEAALWLGSPGKLPGFARSRPACSY